MRIQETVNYNPIDVELSVRAEEIRAITSCRAGKIVPHCVVPVLREDSVRRGSVTLDLEMAETVHPLMNAVSVQVQAHFIPFSAFDRFNGMESFNKSYRGEKERAADAAAVPFFKTMAFDKTAAFWKTLGVHWVNGAQINDAPVEAYNLLVNWMRSMRSKSLALRTLSDTTLAEAFWSNPLMYHIKPDFDQAMMDGEVALTVANGSLPLSAASAPVLRNGSNANVYRVASTGLGVATSATLAIGSNGMLTANGATTQLDPNGALVATLSGITAELGQSGLSLALSTIELAKQTAAFAKFRDQYKGIEDDYLIDLLMQGVRIPEEAMRQPILLDTKRTIFGYTERHAMDGANLDQSVTTGKTRVTVNFRTPPMNTGGLILITSQIVPEQLFERLYDTFLGITSPNQLPRFDRDFLDPEKVEVVPNKFVDVLHSTPTGTFGYAPLNHAWKRSLTRVGGKFYRPVPDAFVEDRQRFWAVEQLNPALNTDFYLVRNTLPHSVFADTVADPFEVVTLGRVEIVGNTVFGKGFEEKDGNYAAVDAVVDKTHIVQP